MLDLNSDHVISADDFEGLNIRVRYNYQYAKCVAENLTFRHYMDWSSNSANFLALKEVHTLFLQHFLTESSKLQRGNSFDTKLHYFPIEN